MTQNFIQSIAVVAKEAETMLKVKSIAYAPNAHLKKSIKSNLTQQGTSRHVIAVSSIGVDARAREYGSGVWAQRGPRGKILIKPKRGRFLIFPWDVATSPISGQISPNIPRTSKGHVILKSVEHPGVDAANEGAGYLRPAAKDTVQFIKSNLGSRVHVAIVEDIRAGFNVG